MTIPENVQLFATHGSFSVPPEIESLIRPEFGARLRRNFSDFVTADLLRDVPDDQKLIPLHGRIGIDPARALDASDISRETDFNSIPIFTRPLTEGEKARVAALSYEPYHAALLDRMLGKHGDPRKSLIAFDLHDTGNWMLGEEPSADRTRLEVQGWEMPPVILSNHPGLVETASPAFMAALQDAFMHRFKLGKDDVQVNTHFKGGYVTQHYGNKTLPALRDAAHQERSVVQVELQRGLYLHERSQTPVRSAVDATRKRLMEVIDDVAGV